MGHFYLELDIHISCAESTLQYSKYGHLAPSAPRISPRMASCFYFFIFNLFRQSPDWFVRHSSQVPSVKLCYIIGIGVCFAGLCAVCAQSRVKFRTLTPLPIPAIQTKLSCCNSLYLLSLSIPRFPYTTCTRFTK